MRVGTKQERKKVIVGDDWKLLCSSNSEMERLLERKGRGRMVGVELFRRIERKCEPPSHRRDDTKDLGGRTTDGGRTVYTTVSVRLLLTYIILSFDWSIDVAPKIYHGYLGRKR
jgi:hypothetical protein